jgi:hypothetical protein
MTFRRLAALVLLGAASTTITAGRAGAQSAPARPADNAAAEVAAEAPDAGPDQPGVVVTLLPTTVRPHAADAGDIVVPLTPIHQTSTASRGSPAFYGFWIGAAGGLALGLAAAGRDSGGEGDTGAGAALIFAPLMFGLFGLGVGALVGVISRLVDSP